MEINSITGTNPYLNPLPENTPSTSETLNETNIQSSRSELDQDTTDVVRQAFNVNISPEARELAATEEPPPPPPEENTTPENEPQQPAQPTNLVNIIA